MAKKPYKKLYYMLKDEALSESLISFLRKVDGAATINGKVANMRSEIKYGDMVEINFADIGSSDIPLSNAPLDILFENEDILVVDKPAGVSTIPSKSHFYDNLAGSVMKHMLGRGEPFVYRPIGRLDKETSGVVVIALNRYAAENVRIEKTYLALCHGNFSEKNFDVDAPILTENVGGINTRKRKVSPDGKPAVTHVKVLENKGENALVALTLDHGRTHQIRVHLSSAGHPLCGDKLYGFDDGFSRLMLDCHTAKITLPDGKVIELKSKLDDHFCTSR